MPTATTLAPCAPVSLPYLPPGRQALPRAVWPPPPPVPGSVFKYLYVSGHAQIDARVIEVAPRIIAPERHGKLTLHVEYGEVHSPTTGKPGGGYVRTFWPSSPTTPPGIFIIKVGDTRPWERQRMTVVHELTHVEQLASGRYRCAHVGGVWSAWWEGKALGAVADIPYAERPWEIEAIRLTDLYDL